MTKLIPDPIVAKERYHVHLRTLGRWDQTPGLGFPPPVYVKQRKYRSADLLDLWDLHNSREAAERAHEATISAGKAERAAATRRAPAPAEAT